MSVLSQFFGGGIGLNARTIPINFLVVGGGGGSGSVNSTLSGFFGGLNDWVSGAGGGGCVNYGNGYNVAPATVLSVTVGAGGAGGVGSGNVTINKGSNGGTSSLVDPTGQRFYAEGGGGGGAGCDPTLPAPDWETYKNGVDGGTGGAGGIRAQSPGPVAGNPGFGKYYKTINIPVAYPSGYPDTQEMLLTQYGELGGFPGASITLSPLSGGSGGARKSTGADAYPQAPQSQTAAPTGNGVALNIEGSLINYGAGNKNQGGVGASRFTPTLPSSYYSANYPYAGPATAATGRGSLGTVSFGYNGPLNPSAHYWVAGGPGSAGNPGVVVVQYPTAFAAAPSFPGASDISPQTPGYYTYKFTSPGSITLP